MSPSINSLYDVYEFYCNANNGNECLVSKRYFEKMARELISDYLDNDGVISNAYFLWKKVISIKGYKYNYYIIKFKIKFKEKILAM